MALKQLFDGPTIPFVGQGGVALGTDVLIAIALRIPDNESANQIASLYHEYGSIVRIPSDKLRSIKNVGDKTIDILQAIYELGKREAQSWFDGKKTDDPLASRCM